MTYFRPIPMLDPARPRNALPLAGGWCWFDRVEVIHRNQQSEVIPANDIPPEVRAVLTAARKPLMGLSLDRPRLMGILNVTPDSFSDGGEFAAHDAALRHAITLSADGADILDIGGESTRPGAEVIPISDEIARTAPLIQALADRSYPLPISIDTRKAGVARAALDAGAAMVNDVAALSFDPGLAPLIAARSVPLCLMHAQGTPQEMQVAPHYANVLLDVYDFLNIRIKAAVAAGIPRERLIIDPGIGFGKTLDHNLSLIRGLSLFHGLGCPILLGASRKRFIGTISGTGDGATRAPGTLAVTLAAVAQGVQIHRVHDIAIINQGLRLSRALTSGETG